MHKTHEDVIRAALDRMEKAVIECQNLQIKKRGELVTTQAVSLTRDINKEVARLGGKAEGVKLAMSYLHEELRIYEY